MHSKAATVDEYLAELPDDRRAALSELRALIREVAPDAAEGMAYGMASYDLGGPLFGLASQKGYMAQYVSAPEAVDAHRSRLGKLDCGKGCIRFKALADLPLHAVGDIVRAAALGRGASGEAAVVKKSTTGTRKPTAKAAKAAPQPAAPSDWREETLARMRALILEAEPGMAEERKWKKPSNPAGVPVWSHGGIVCTGETYKQVVKLTFARGASLPDPSGLFNASLDGGTRRAIDIREGETVDTDAFRALVRAAVAQNGSSAEKPGQSAG